jgi:hypothetical protein
VRHPPSLRMSVTREKMKSGRDVSSTYSAARVPQRGSGWRRN